MAFALREKDESTYKRDLKKRIELINWVLEKIKNPNIHICSLIESRMNETILEIDKTYSIFEADKLHSELRIGIALKGGKFNKGKTVEEHVALRCKEMQEEKGWLLERFSRTPVGLNDYEKFKNTIDFYNFVVSKFDLSRKKVSE